MGDISGKFAGGHLHWSTICGDGSFDVEREVFGTLEQPKSGEGCDDVDLSVLGGSICMCYYYDTHVDSWVIKEYGRGESWTKIITLPGFLTFGYPRSILPNDMVDCSFFRPLPPEIILLIRLPVKTFSTLKCVCRRFYRFDSCPDFNQRAPYVLD